MNFFYYKEAFIKILVELVKVLDELIQKNNRLELIYFG